MRGWGAELPPTRVLKISWLPNHRSINLGPCGAKEANRLSVYPQQYAFRHSI